MQDILSTLNSIFQFIFIDLVNILQDFIVDFGVLGLIFAMIMQSIISPIPSELLLSLAGSAYIESFGTINGFTLAFVGSLIGSLIGALICFYIGYYLESWIAKRISTREFNAFQSFIEKYGIWAIIIARIAPFLPFDAISYIAGIVKIDRNSFLIGTFIGLIPRIIFYTLIGGGVINLVEQDFFFGMIILTISVSILIILMIITKDLLLKKNNEKEMVKEPI